MYKFIALWVLILISACSNVEVEYPHGQTPDIAADVVRKMQPMLANVDVAFVDSNDTLMAQISCTEDGFCLVEVNRLNVSIIGAGYGDGAVAYIFAHELSHIQQFYPFTASDRDNKLNELEADEGGGCVVRMLGYTTDGIRDFIYRELRTNGESSTHPDSPERWDAFQKGYNCLELKEN